MIIAVITAGLFFLGCNADENQSTNTTNKTVVKQKEVAVEKTVKTKTVEKKSTWQKVKEKAAETAKKTKEVTKKAVEVTKQKAKEFNQEHNVTEKTKAAVASLKKKTHEIDKKYHVSKKTKATITVIKQKTKKVIAKITSPNPEILYKKCAGCHGNKAQNHALGKSKIIHNFTTKQISEALHGYKNGTYGGTMKAVMAGQVKSLSDEDISVLAKYIPTLK